ncbi:MAG: aspartate kinase, partial [Flammeovirgaceae bacterium]
TNQVLISIAARDFSFIAEENLSSIFSAFASLGVKINLMQNSAISFSFCVDYRENKIMKLIEMLSQQFEVYFNTNLTLITIKNYDSKTSAEFKNIAGLILEQSSRSTLQVLVKGS